MSEVDGDLREVRAAVAIVARPKLAAADSTKALSIGRLADSRMDSY